MPVLHALHQVIFGLFILSNLALVPLAAMIGISLGDLAASMFNLNDTARSIVMVAAGFMGVGLINGLPTSVIIMVLRGQAQDDKSKDSRKQRQLAKGGKQQSAQLHAPKSPAKSPARKEAAVNTSKPVAKAAPKPAPKTTSKTVKPKATNPRATKAGKSGTKASKAKTKA